MQKVLKGIAHTIKKKIVISSNADFGYQVKILAHEVGHLLMHKDITDYRHQRAKI